METIAHTRYGALRGVASGAGTVSWRGIRYAAPPTGERRWRAPARPEHWDGAIDASSFGTRAPQVLTPELVPPGGAEPSDADTPFGEDCLFVNVTAPVKAEGPSPVLVWFHGGGYIWGSGANYIGDGVALAQDGIIVVTVNYRLGALGFLRLDHLLGPQYAPAVNAGLLDQIAALRWVRENIAAFGGDPDRVTIAGVSAGGKSVANLMAAPETQGTFQRAIVQSGGDHVNTLEGAAELTSTLLAVLGLDAEDAAQLLSVPADVLLQAQQQIATGVRATWLWRPTVDGTVLPTTPTAALASGRAAGISMMAGVTRNEAGSYDVADPSAADQTPRVLQEIFGIRGAAVHFIYQASRPEADQRTVHRAIMADERYGIPTIGLLDAQTSHGPCWRYRFDAPTPGAPQDKWGFHGADVPYVWDIGLDHADSELRSLSAGMRASWAAFIHGGKPDAPGLPYWPEYDTSERTTMILDRQSTVETDPHSAERQAWSGMQWTPGTWWDLP
ncbi:carboxylesterase/lipase family protein [Arthrobacter sp. PM3]|uniref:carboxylesterase/lipase family protein n=1 Tax=Arthrobacter sp. PM3 TaxID=2017685 RepID=UPI001ABF8DF1|nr:carboxylesterase/lipase family protein [Arthrobacter sp. PM3]